MSIKVLKVSETKAFDMEGALKQVQKLIDGGMKTKEAIKRVAQEMNGSKNELYDAYHKHIWSCESRIFFIRDGKMQFLGLKMGGKMQEDYNFISNL